MMKFPSQKALSEFQAVTRNGNFLLAVVLVVAAALRFYGLEIQSLWYDELWSYNASSHSTLAEVVSEVQGDLHPPGYQFILFLVEKSGGRSELALRLPSAVAGVLAVYFLYILGKRCYSWREGVLGAALTAVTWFPIYYSQEARAYSFLFLLSILTTLLWYLLWIESKMGKRTTFATLCGYVLLSVCISYVHYYGLYLVFLHGGFALILAIAKRQHFGRWVICYASIALSYLPWLPTLLDHSAKAPHRFSPPTYHDAVSFAWTLFSRSSIFAIVVLIVIAYLSFVRLKSFYKGKSAALKSTRICSSDVVLILWLVIPFVGMYVKSLLSVPALSTRGLIISSPAAYLLLGRLFIVLVKSSRALLVVSPLVVCFLLFHLLFVLKYYTLPTKTQNREATYYVVDRENQYKNAIVLAYTWGEYSFNYYFQQRSSSLKVDILGGANEDIHVLDSTLTARQPRYVWLMASQIQPKKEALTYLNEHLVLIDHQEWYGASVWLFHDEGVNATSLARR